MIKLFAVPNPFSANPTPHRVLAVGREWYANCGWDAFGILAALAATKYPGDAAIEPFIYEPDGPTCAARQIGYLRGLIEAGNT